MESTKEARLHFERVLIVVGFPNAGKSTLLRNMFAERRFGTCGKIPGTRKLKPVPLSNERCLSIRFSSPHERGQSLERFAILLEQAMKRAARRYSRFNFACAMQPDAKTPTPSLVEICKHLRKKFHPERIRVVQIDPRQDGRPGSLLSAREVNKLRTMKVELITIDGRRPKSVKSNPNGLVLASFFDFV